MGNVVSLPSLCLSLLVPSCPCFFPNLSWSSLCQLLGLSTEVKLGEGIWDGCLPCQAPPEGYPQERKLGRSQILSEGPLLLLGFTQLETNLQTSPSSRFQEPPVPGLLGHRLFAICLRDLMCIKLCILCSMSMLSVSSSEILMPGKRLSSGGKGNSKELSFCPSLSLSPSSLSSLLF